MIVIEVRRYVARSGSDVIGGWLASLEDLKARARIAARLDRLSLGNFGDCKALRDGVSELRIDWGTRIPGVLRDVGQDMRASIVRRRQAPAVVGHQKGDRIPG